MSKFLKFIVNIFLICAILIAAAILIPPLAGVQTTIVDTASMDTNLPLGSITYSTDVDASEIKNGDEVLKDSSTATYAYIVKSINRDTDTFTVVNAMDQNAQTEEITLRNSVPKVAVVVPYIGYVIIAMHSTEGIIIIALVVVLIIILFILSELWKEKPEEEEEDEKDQKTYSFVEGEEEKRGADTDTVTPEESGSGEAAEKPAEEEPASAEEEPLAEGGSLTEEKPLTEDKSLTGEESAPETETASLEDDGSEDTAEEDEAPAAETGTTEASGEEADIPEISPDRQDTAPQSNPGDDLERALAGIYSEPEETKRPSEGEDDIRFAEPDATADQDGRKADEASTPEDEIKPGDTQEFHLDADLKRDANTGSDAYDLSDVIEQATREAEEQAEKDAAKAGRKEPAVPTEESAPENTADAEEAEGTETEDATKTPEASDEAKQNPSSEETPETEDEEPEQFVPVEHATLDELLDQAKKAGDEPDVSKDDATGITVVDYSGVL